MRRLLRSAEADGSTERCWNWRAQTLAIGDTMRATHAVSWHQRRSGEARRAVTARRVMHVDGAHCGLVQRLGGTLLGAIRRAHAKHGKRHESMAKVERLLLHGSRPINHQCYDPSWL